MAIALTDRAVSEVRTIMKDQSLDAQKMFLRVGVRGGGCSGLSYTLDLTEDLTDKDEQWDVDGVKVICDTHSHVYLSGASIDFKDELTGKGFVFDNPNRTSSCGCGSSC